MSVICIMYVAVSSSGRIELALHIFVMRYNMSNDMFVRHNHQACILLFTIKE